MRADGSCTISATFRLGDGWARCGKGAPPPEQSDPNAIALSAPALPSSEITPTDVPPDPNTPSVAATPPQTSLEPAPYAEEHGANLSPTAAGVLGGLSGALTACITLACW